MCVVMPRKKAGNGHDDGIAFGVAQLNKMMRAKKAPDEIIKSYEYSVGALVACLTAVPCFFDERGRLWAEHPSRFIKIYDPAEKFK